MDPKIIKKLEEFFTQFKLLQYKRNEILLRAEDNPSGVYYLKEGLVGQHVITEKGDELALAIHKPPSVFPISWAINNISNIYFYMALKPIQVWRASKEEFLKLIRNDSEILFNLLSNQLNFTDELFIRRIYSMTGNTYTRLITELIKSAKQFGKVVKPNVYTFDFKVTERALANLISTAPETISREFKILKDKGLVSFNKNILTINNLSCLEKELLENG